MEFVISLDHRKRVGERDRLKDFCLMMLCSRYDFLQVRLCPPNCSQTCDRALQQIKGIKEVRNALEVDRSDHRAPVRQYYHQALAREARQRFANWRPRQSKPLAETDLVDGRPWRQFHPKNFFAKTGVDARAARLLDGPNDLALTLNSHVVRTFQAGARHLSWRFQNPKWYCKRFARGPMTCCGIDASLPRPACG